MRVKICGIQNETDLQTAVRAGADAVGFQVGQLYASRSFILPSTARRLMEQLPVLVVPVLVTHLNTADEILELIKHSGIASVQLSRNCAPAEIAVLRDKMPAFGKIIYTDYIHNLTPEMVMAELIPLVDAVDLDCCNAAADLVGVDTANKCYAWDAAAEYIQKSVLPVIVSGRLNAENVRQAIRTAKPFGVDACSLLKNPDGGLNESAAAAFVWNSKQEFFNR